MNETQKILLIHQERYPLMQTEDFVKLLYQNTFGPRHFSANPSLEAVVRFLEEELSISPYDPRTPLREDIGGGYLRMSLENIRSGKMTLTEMAEAFWRSMNDGREITEESERLFRKKITDFMDLIRSGKLSLDGESAQIFLDRFLEEGIRPIHHSTLFNETYHPHYRVIHQKFLPSTR